MKKLFRLFLSSLLLTFILALLIPASGVLAKSKQPARPMSTIPYCYGDSWGSYQACDGLPHQNTTNCPRQSLVNAKAIGSLNQGQIGSLYIYYSGNTSQGLPYGCNAWWAAIKITHSGCYDVPNIEVVENNADGSVQQNWTTSLCQNQWIYTNMIGDWQPGGCYYATSDVFAGTDQFTTTITSCF